MNIKVYGKTNCPGCDQAKALLDQRGIGYEYINVMNNMDALRKLLDQGLKSVPQVFVNGELLGGVEALQKHLEG